MLKQAIIQNFRSLKLVDVELRPLTVLVGPNDTGKSTFLEALRRSLAARDDLSDSDRWRNSPDQMVRIELRTDRAASISFNESAAIAQGINPRSVLFSNPARHQYADPPLYQLPARGVVLTSEGFTDAEGPRMPSIDGTGVAGYLDYLNRRDRVRLDRIVATLRSLVPGLENVVIGAPDRQLCRVDFVIEEGLEIRGDDASAGVRLLLFFIAVAHHPSPPALILIEEPETGIHPRRIADVMTLLRRITRGEIGGHAAQVILTTHSPYLLDCVNLDTDQVLVFRRNDDGSRDASAVDAEGLKVFLDEFLLGEIWYNEGDERLVVSRS